MEKSPAEAITFYIGKVDDLAKNMGDIEKVVSGKSENLRLVEDVLRRRMVEEQPAAYGAGVGDGGRQGQKGLEAGAG